MKEKDPSDSGNKKSLLAKFHSDTLNITSLILTTDNRSGVFGSIDQFHCAFGQIPKVLYGNLKMK